MVNPLLNITKLIVALTFLSIKLNAQSYIPMLKSHSEWHVTNCFSGCATDKYYTIGDTVINNLHYTFLDLFHYNKNFVIREDTIAKKVYMRLMSEPATVKEYLLYDFSLNVNDTISVINPGSPFPKYAGSFQLDSIAIKPVLTGNRKFFYLHALDTLTSQTKNTVWIEGIGSQCLINTPGAPAQINGAGQLSCFFNNNIHHYQNLDSISNCISIYPTNVKEFVQPSEVTVSQNYDENHILFNAAFSQFPLKIYIYNTDGESLVSSVITNDQRKFKTDKLPNGLLLIKIETYKKEILVVKIFNP